ncbi:hypothetical protein ACFSJY_16995 [Thalassotalea euphylliae]|uniref:hypothetical protein n=1 Tax=Thalassotalea euphylliae TaxID=1655234 RepID=UPI003643FF98
MNNNHSIFKDEMAHMHKLTIALITLLFLITGCGDPVQEQLDAQIPLTEQRVKQLGDMLDNNQVRNAKLITQYAEHLAGQKPQFLPLIDEFKKDAGTQGPMYLALLDRLKTVKEQPQMFASSQARFEELLNIYQAADPILFSDALSDPLNVLSDMSDGELPRVNAMSKSQSLAANNAQDFGVGEQLIGNPSYGQWQTDSSGTSFWMWYGMYRMLDDVLDIDGFGKRKRRVYYHNWGSKRNYSYYHDYGRTRFSSPTQLQKQSQIENRTRKSFQGGQQKFTSAYGKNRSGASGVSSQSKTAQASANKFRTNNAKKSTYAKSSNSKYAKSASFRNSSSSTTRGFRRGK